MNIWVNFNSCMNFPYKLDFYQGFRGFDHIDLSKAIKVLPGTAIQHNVI